MQVHKPGIATALARLNAEGLTNVKIAAGDAVKALMDHVRDRSLDECCVFFPDPFPQDHESDRCGTKLIHPPPRNKVHLGLKPLAVHSRWRSLEISCFLVGAHEHRMITSRYLLIFRGVDY